MKILLLLSALILSFNGFAQYPGIAWQKCLGGTANEEINCVRKTSDSGYIICGYTSSNNGDVTGYHGSSDAWVVKLSPIGSVTWKKCFGGTDYDGATCIRQTFDGGYILAGGTQSSDGDVTYNHGGIDVWVVKLTSNGTISWQKTYGGLDDDEAYSIQQTNDSGYIIAAETYSSDLSGFHGSSRTDILVIKIDNTGSLLWQKCLGGSGWDFVYGSDVVVQTKDNNYVIAGSAGSNDGNITGYHGGSGEDVWVIKLNDTGGIIWQKTLGGSSPEEGTSILENQDSELVVVGDASSTDGDVTGYHGGGSDDVWVVKLNESGNLIWEKCYGGSSDDIGRDINLCKDGSYILCGATNSLDGDLVNSSGGYGGYDYWVVKLDTAGHIIGQATLGGDTDEIAYSIQQTFDNGYIGGGYTQSNNDDVSGNHGSRQTEDAWVVKLNKNLKVEPLNKNESNIKVYPTITNSFVYIDLPEDEKNAEVDVYDVTGNKMNFSSTLGSHRTINMQNLPPGMYILQVVNASDVQSFKIVHEP